MLADFLYPGFVNGGEGTSEGGGSDTDSYELRKMFILDGSESSPLEVFRHVTLTGKNILAYSVEMRDARLAGVLDIAAAVDGSALPSIQINNSNPSRAAAIGLNAVVDAGDTITVTVTPTSYQPGANIGWVTILFG